MGSVVDVVSAQDNMGVPDLGGLRTPVEKLVNYLLVIISHVVLHQSI